MQRSKTLMLDKKSKLVDDKLKSDNIINLNNSKIEMQKCNNLNENYIEKVEFYYSWWNLLVTFNIDLNFYI